MSDRSAVVSQPAGIDKIIEYPAFGSQETVKLSVAIVQQYIAVPTREGDIPDDRECIKFVMLCKARGLNPFEGDAFLIGYKNRNEGTVKWSLITSHQAFLKRAELNPAHNGMQSGVIVKTADDKIEEREGDLVLDGEALLGAWAVVFRKDQSVQTRKRLDVAKYRKTYGVWNENPAMMAVKCVEADALRTAYPTLLGGLYLREELERIGGDVPTSTPAPAPTPLFKDLTPRPVARAAEPAPNATQDTPTDIAPDEPQATKPPRKSKAAPAEAPAQPATASATEVPVKDQERLDTIKSIRANRRYWVKGFTEIALKHGIDTVNGVNWEDADTDTLKLIDSELREYVEQKQKGIGQ